MSHDAQAADPEVDVAALTSFLDGRWGWVKDEARQILREPLFHPIHGLGIEAYRERTFEQLNEIAKSEGVTLGFPKSVGGLDDTGGFVSAFETLAHGDLSLLVKIGVQFGLFGGAIHHLGNEDQHARYLPQVMSVELPGCFAMTETGHGSDVQALRTTSVYEPETEQFVINTPDRDAFKDYIGNAARDGKLAIVFAQLITQGETHGVHAFLVPIRDEAGRPCEGVTIEDDGHKAGLHGVDNGRLAFDTVSVPREALLDRYGQVAADGAYTSPIDNRTKRFFTMLGTLVQGRVSVAGGGLSATKTALTIAVRYGLARRQFSPPDGGPEILLMDYLAHQRRLLPRLAKTYALHFAQQVLVERLDTIFHEADAPEHERRELESLAAGVKAVATWHATDTIQTCREACGGQGYLSINRLAQLKNDTDVFTTFEGDNTVLLQLVARGLLTDYRDEFGSLDTLGMVRFLADQVVDTVVEATSARQLVQSLVAALPGRDDAADLLGRDTQRALFAWREEHLIRTVALRLKRGMDDGGDPFDVFNACQDHVLEAAHAHVDGQLLEAFTNAVDRCDDDDLTTLLDTLCDLYALSTIEEHRGWYQEHGRLNAARSKAVVAAVNDLCRQLRPHALAFVDAFAIPDEAIAAPIALGDEAERQAIKNPGGWGALSR